MTAKPAFLLPEILKQISAWVDRSQPIGRLFCTSSAAAKGLRTVSGRLQVGSINATCLRAMRTGLHRASWPDLQALQLDLSGFQAAERYCSLEIDDVLFELGHCLLQASSLTQLRVRLASFDEKLNRVRLSPIAWQALIMGLNGIARFDRLRELELSYITIKEQHAVQLLEAHDLLGRFSHDSRPTPLRARSLRRASTAPTDPSASACSGKDARDLPAPMQRTFLDTLAQLTELEALRLTHDEMHGSLVLRLPPIVAGLKKLKLLDLTRNHVPKQVMDNLLDAIPNRVQILGADQQTFYFR